MTTADILNRAANRLEQQGAWTQLALAKDADGVQVPPSSGTACQWCSKGAIRAETFEVHAHIRAEAALARVIGTHQIAMWNDNPARTQNEVVAAFRKAAQEA